MNTKFSISIRTDDNEFTISMYDKFTTIYFENPFRTYTIREGVKLSKVLSTNHFCAVISELYNNNLCVVDNGALILCNGKTLLI